MGNPTATGGPATGRAMITPGVAVYWSRAPVLLTANDKLLDLGCGEGRHALSAYISKELEVYAVDLSISDLEITKSRFSEFYESENKKKTP